MLSTVLESSFFIFRFTGGTGSFSLFDLSLFDLSLFDFSLLDLSTLDIEGLLIRLDPVDFYLGLNSFKFLL